ncbi:MAG: Ankyrin repeat domain-containing protein 17, partial [Paramarteilia canceri]
DNPNFTSIINIDYTTSKSHDTALTIACTKGFIDIVSLLLKAGANIEHKNRRGYTSLMLAAENNHCQIIHLLLEYEADVQNETEKTHDTALGISCAAGSLDSALILLENGANINHQNHNDYTPLCFASSSGNLNIVKKLIDADAIIDGSRDSCKSGITPLMLATMQNNIGIVKYLLEKGANVDAKIEANKATPITFASAQSFIDILNILIEYGANIEHRSKSGLTPLMEATINGNNEACNILLNAGAEVNPPCVASSKDSPLTLAATNDSLETIISLCKKGAIIEHRNKKNVTALWIAASNGFFNIVRYLHSEMHASLSQEDSRGVSTLFVAFRNGHIKVVDYLAKKLSHLPTEKDVEKFANSLKVSNKIELRNDIKSSSELENNIRLSKEIISKARDVQTRAAGKNIKQFLKSFGGNFFILYS